MHSLIRIYPSNLREVIINVLNDYNLGDEEYCEEIADEIVSQCQDDDLDDNEDD